MKGALEGIRVIDFTQLVQGALASQMLGDLGADIIKIERIGGEWMRHWSVYDYYINGEGAAFLAYNRNKRSICLNLKSPSAKKIIYQLVSKSDVVMENFRPGVMDRLGYGYEKLKEINPKIIFASATGFGSTGPYTERPGQDLLMQGFSGLMWLTGRKDDPPTPCGVGIGDLYGASMLAYGILGALVYRERTGQGQKVECNLLDSLLAMQLQELVYFLNSGKTPERSKTNMGHTGAGAPFGIYKTKDGAIALAMMPLPKLAEILNEPWLAQFDSDAKGLAHRDEIKGKLDPIFAGKTTQEWLVLLDKHDVWCARINNYDNLPNDPQVKHNKSFQSCGMKKGKTFKTVGSPVRMSHTPPSIYRSVPGIGEHTMEVLKELGYSDSNIAQFAEEGVIQKN